MALGTAAIIAQLLGAGANYLIGRGQESEGEELAQQGREDLLATAGPTAALLAGVDEQKGLIKDAQARGQRQLDTSVAGFLDALQSGAPTASALVPSFAGSVADASSDLGARTAQAMAAANQPAIDAAESAMDVSRSLAGMDLQQGTEAFNQGRQTQYNAFGQALGLPMDLASLQIANPDAFASLFPNIKAEGGKLGQQGTYTGGGINMKTVKSLLDAMPRKEKKEEEDKKKDKKRVGEATDTVDKVNNLAAMGGVMKPGDVFKTPGPEDHNKKEFDIVDAESGQTVARTTGQENHTINNDDPDQRYKIVDKDTKKVLMESEGGSMSVLNSDQSGSIHDAFKAVDVPMLLKSLENYPQKSQVRDLMSALNVFTLPQFQD